MSSIFINGKIRTGLLCVSVFLYSLSPLYGAPPHQLPDQSVTSEGKEPSAVPPASQPTASPAKDVKKKEGVKQAHPGPSHGKFPPKPQSYIQQQNPVDLSTGQELLPMPDEPNR